MKFIEYIKLSESTKDLYQTAGVNKTKSLLATPKNRTVASLHDKVFGKGHDHIEIPLKTGVPESVKDHVESNGDKIHPDQDKAILKTGREVPLSKYLAKSKAPKDVQDEYENHARHKVSDETKLVISRKPAEVASASCGTSWKSCATPDDEGLAWKRMRAEIKHGTMIAMQVHKDAKPNEHGEYDGKDVHGRVLLKRHDSENGHVVFRPESRSYGKFGENAKKAASDFAEKHYPMKDITYMKHESLYDDDKTKFKINPKTSEDELHKIFDNADHALRISMLEQPNAHSSLIHKALDDKSNAPFAKEAAIKNSSVNSEHITKALNLNGSIHRITRAYAAGHPKATSEHITKALNDPSPIVREAAIKNTNGAVKDEHYIKAFDDVDEDVRSSAVRCIKSPKHIDIALNKEQPESVRSQASRNEHANENHIHKALDDDSEWVRLGAIRNKNATRKNIEKALNDPDLSHIARDRMAEFDAHGK